MVLPHSHKKQYRGEGKENEMLLYCYLRLSQSTSFYWSLKGHQPQPAGSSNHTQLQLKDPSLHHLNSGQLKSVFPSELWIHGVSISFVSLPLYIQERFQDTNGKWLWLTTSSVLVYDRKTSAGSFVRKPTSPKAEADHGLFMHNVSPTYRSVAHKSNVNNSWKKYQGNIQ